MRITKQIKHMHSQSQCCFTTDEYKKKKKLKMPSNISDRWSGILIVNCDIPSYILFQLLCEIKIRKHIETRELQCYKINIRTIL